MEYSRSFGNKFWLEFDRPFNGMFYKTEFISMVNRTVICRSAFLNSYDRENNKLDIKKFKESIVPHNVKEDISQLANRQIEIINENFSDSNSLQMAFEDFGQGILYDVDHDKERTYRNRNGSPIIDSDTGNPLIFRIHMMDDFQQYFWWHAFIRAGILFELINEDKWFEIDRCILLSFLIHEKVKPKQAFKFHNFEIPENHPQFPLGDGSPEIVKECRSIAIVENFEEIDRKFFMA